MSGIRLDVMGCARLCAYRGSYGSADSGARLVGTAVLEMNRRNGSTAIATMCIGVGQGIASLWVRV